VATGQRTQRRWIYVVGAVAAVAALVLGFVLASDDGDDDEAEPTTTSQVDATSSTSTTAGATSTTVPASADDVDVAVFPDVAGGERFEDPVALVRAFATQVLGFDTGLDVGELQEGDSRSGEVVVRPATETGQGPDTTVAVRRISDDSWVVVTAFTESIQLVAPETGMPVAAPLDLQGSAYAFEGHVDVALYVDGESAPIGTTFVTGRGDGVPGEFTGELEFDAPDGATHGVLVLSEPSAQDGTTWRAVAIRVKF
jgi:hypothetical protein